MFKGTFHITSPRMLWSFFFKNYAQIWKNLFLAISLKLNTRSSIVIPLWVGLATYYISFIDTEDVWRMHEDVMTRKLKITLSLGLYFHGVLSQLQFGLPFQLYMSNHCLFAIFLSKKTLWSSKTKDRNLFTVACNCSFLVKRFRLHRNLLLFL